MKERWRVGVYLAFDASTLFPYSELLMTLFLTAFADTRVLAEDALTSTEATCGSEPSAMIVQVTRVPLW